MDWISTALISCLLIGFTLFGVSLDNPRNLTPKRTLPSHPFSSRLSIEKVVYFLDRREGISLEGFLAELPVEYRGEFTLVYDSLSAQKVAKRMVENPLYQKIKYGLLSEKLGCLNTFGYGQRMRIERGYRKWIDIFYPRLNRKMRKFRIKNTPSIFMGHWNMNFREHLDSYFNGFAIYEESLIVDYFLLKFLAQSDPDFEKHFKFKSWAKSRKTFLAGTNYLEAIDDVVPYYDKRHFHRSGGRQSLKEIHLATSFSPIKSGTRINSR